MERDRERRETVERYHRLKDFEEDFVVAKQTAKTPEERQRLMNEMGAYRQKHREEDVARGKRVPGFAIRMHSIMWPRWIEVAVNHEMVAHEIYAELAEGRTHRLSEELNQSLVAVIASACMIEALYADVVYLIPEQAKARTTPGRIAQVIDAAFGLDRGHSSTTRDQLHWLFDRRNEAAHPYTQLEPPSVHPAGLNSSAETAKFNAVESSRAVDIAMAVLELAAAPPNPHGRWVIRWVTEREPYHSTVIAPLRERRAAGRPTQAQPTDTD
jgi:hypothetical protein